MRLFLMFILSLAWQATANTNTAGFSYQQQPVPAWVETSPAQQAASDRSEPVSYLLVDEQLNWLNAEPVAYSHIAMQANTRKGVEQASQYQVSFAPEYQQLTFHSIRLTRNGDTKEQLGTADIRLVQREQEHERQIYTGYVTAMVLLSDMQPGDRLDIQYSITGTNPIYGGKRSVYFPLNWSVAVQQLQLRVLSSAEKLAYYSNRAGVIPQQRKVGDHYEYRLQQSDIAAVKAEDNYPQWFMPYGFIEFNEFGRWQDVVAWAMPLYQFNEPLHGDLQLLVKSWLAESDSQEDYAARVVHYVQNDIRYFGIEIGLNSHQPFSPNMVFSRKYGDCKDKTTLMIALLAAGGIEAYPALVSSATRGHIQRRLPGPIAFDHVITYLPLNGRDYWLDGTRSQQYGSLDQKGRQYFQQALLIKEGVTALTAVPMPTTTDGIIESEEQYQLGAVGDPVMLNVSISYQQYEAESFRGMLDQHGLTEYANYLERVYQRQYPGADLVDHPVISDDKQNNQVRVVANFIIDKFWDETEPKQELLLFGDFLERFTQLPKNTRRKMPLYIEPNVRVQHRIHFDLASPIDWQFEDLQLEIDSPGFVYLRQVETSAHSITAVHHYQSKSDHITPEQALDFVSAVKKVREAMYFTVVIDKTDPAPELLKEIRRRLSEMLKASETP